MIVLEAAATNALTTWIPLITAAATTIATLVGIGLTQRANQRSQKQQLDATAALEHARRESAERVERERREHDQLSQRWVERRDLYGQVLLRSGSVLTLIPKARAGTRTMADADAIADDVQEFFDVAYRALLMAPTATAHALDEFIGAVNGALRTLASDEAARKAAATIVQECRGRFLAVARRDLGTDSGSADPPSTPAQSPTAPPR